MRAKKKLIISMLVVSFVLLSIIATVAIAFALTQQTIKTTLNIGYTVEDIDGTASATFTIGGVTENLTAMKGTQVIGDKLVFKAGDTEDAGNLMFPEDALALSAQNDNVVIQYTYSNTGGKHYIASMDFAANIEADNMKVEYSIDGTTYSEQRYAVVVPANTANKSYWIKISIADKAKSASFTGDFDWLLSGCDPQDKAYLSMPDLEFQGSDGAYSASIASNSEYVGNLVFPSEVNGDKVTTISQNTSLTDEQKAQVASVYIPDSVETIGTGAFNGFTNMETVTLEQNETVRGASASSSSTGLTTIGNNAFFGCVSLKEIKIPNTVGTLGMQVFAQSGLTSVKIPDNIYELPISAFSGCVDLSSIDLNNLYYIGNEAFYGCSKLTTLNLKKVLCIGQDVFINSGVTNVTIHNCSPDALPALKTISNLNLTIANGVIEITDHSFMNFTNLKTVQIPDSVTTIGMGAFTFCTSLTSVVIPNSVTEIKQSAFSDCSNLSSVVLSNKITELSFGIFQHSGLTTIVIPEGVTTVGICAFTNCQKLTSVEIPSSVTSIGNEAFTDCRTLTGLVLNNPNGWKLEGVLSTANLSDPAIAANEFVTKSMDGNWTRE